MPLSHVCVWDADIGYKRISLESACKMYPNGASAKSGYFVCELCAQNVLLTAPGVNVRHFRHDPSSPNKECDERQAHFDPLYGRRLRNLNSHLMPLRITVAKESFALQMGFFCPPDSEARCDKIRITTNSGKAYEYSFERIERGGTTYLNIGETPSREYNLEYINAAADLVKFWPSKVPGISSSGSFFDERTGQILPSGAKAYFGDSYYLLQSKPLGDPPTGLEVSEVLRTKTGSLATWYLYKIQTYSVRYVRQNQKGDFIDIYLYDSLSSGAGYAVSIEASIQQLLIKTRELLSSCNCDSACHKCLKHYRNQYVHGLLDRSAALDLLTWAEKGVRSPMLPVYEQRNLLQSVEQILQFSGVHIDFDHEPIEAESFHGKKRIVVYPAMWARPTEKNMVFVSDSYLKYAKPYALKTIVGGL